ncbi:MAG: MBL fold metallo-hydrolase [Candidatus Xiphinematobacter sp.]|nr:MAG: MBL fold metallo-hydrolase [Candidatus Xiphinematobacter sp.]
MAEKIKACFLHRRNKVGYLMAKLELTFLGTGTSSGVPVIGCDCEVCRSQDPKDYRLRPSILLRTEQICLIVDTPPDFRAQCLRANIRSMDAVLYTHAHSDHILGFDDLCHFLKFKNSDTPIYGVSETLTGIKRMFFYAFREAGNQARPHLREIHGEFNLGDLRIVPVDLPHGLFTTAGFVFYHAGRKALAYYTDCSTVPSRAEGAARGVEVLVVGALRYTSHPTHLTVQGALRVAKHLSSRTCYFTHMGHELKYEQIRSSLPSRVFPAYDGLQVQI